MTNPSPDTSAAEVVAWRFQWLRLDGTPTSDGWHLAGEKPTLLPTVATVEPLVLKSSYDAMRAERDEASANVFVPGEFCCPKCGFFLSQFKLRASDGAIGELAHD